MRNFTLMLFAFLCITPALMSAQSCKDLYDDGYDYYSLGYTSYETGLNLYNESKKLAEGLASKLAYGEDIDEDLETICTNLYRVMAFYDNAQYYLKELAIPKMKNARDNCTGENKDHVMKVLNACIALHDELNVRKNNVQVLKDTWSICQK